MDHLQELIRYAVVLALLVLSTNASAATTSICGGVYTSVSAAQTACAAGYNATPSNQRQLNCSGYNPFVSGACGVSSTTSDTTWAFQYYDPAGQTTNNVSKHYAVLKSGQSCPGGGTPDANGLCPSTITCPSGQIIFGDGSCQTAPTVAQCQARTSSFYWIPQAVDQKALSAGYCVDGCNMTDNDPAGGVSVGIGGSGMGHPNDFFVKMWTAGTTCASQTVQSDASQSTAQQTTVGGSTWKGTGENCGLVDGEQVCVNSLPDNHCVTTRSGAVVCSANAISPPAPDTGTLGSKATPDGKIATVGTDGKHGTVDDKTADIWGKSGNGTNSTVKGTTSGGGTPGTTNGDGSGTRAGTGTNGQTSTGTCDPAVQFCGNNSIGSLDCSATFSCNGDPVFCGSARLQWETKCSLNGGTAVQTAAANLKAQLDAEGDTNLSGGVRDISTAVSFNEAGYFSHTCPADTSVDVLGATVTIPWSAVCPYIDKLRFLILAMAYFYAALIIFRTLTEV